MQPRSASILKASAAVLENRLALPYGRRACNARTVFSESESVQKYHILPLLAHQAGRTCAARAACFMFLNVAAVHDISPCCVVEFGTLDFGFYHLCLGL